MGTSGDASRPARAGAVGAFVLGMLFMLALLGGSALLFLKLGYFPVGADAKASDFEIKLATMARNAAVDRSAPREANPVPDDEANLLDGMKLYKTTCSECHGRMRGGDGVFSQSLYPPAPPFTEQATDLSEQQIFFIARHGIRMTGMPSFSRMLSDEEIWKIARFVKRMHALPPAVNDQWQHPSD